MGAPLGVAGSTSQRLWEQRPTPLGAHDDAYGSTVGRRWGARATPMGAPPDAAGEHCLTPMGARPGAYGRKTFAGASSVAPSDHAGRRKHSRPAMAARRLAARSTERPRGCTAVVPWQHRVTKMEASPPPSLHLRHHVALAPAFCSFDSGGAARGWGA